MNASKFLVALFALFICLQSQAQTKDRGGDYLLWQPQQELPQRIFSSIAYIRESPSSSAAIVDSLSFGDTLRVGEKSKNFITIKNIYAPWVNVTAVKNGKNISGYMWQGLVALGHVQDNNTLYLYGIDKIDIDPKKKDDYNKGVSYVISVCALNKSSVEVARKTWVMPDDGSLGFTSIMLLGDTKLKNLQQVVRLECSGEACAIPTNFFYAGYTGSALLSLPGKQNVSDAGVFSHVETLLFPSEKGGKANQIIHITTDKSYEDNEKDPDNPKVTTSSSRQVYLWDGVTARKQKAK